MTPMNSANENAFETDDDLDWQSEVGCDDDNKIPILRRTSRMTLHYYNDDYDYDCEDVGDKREFQLLVVKLDTNFTKIFPGAITSVMKEMTIAMNNDEDEEESDEYDCLK
jgi:hypothetical protein